MATLRSLQKDFIRLEIINKCKEVAGEQNFKLVLDEITTKIISSCISMSELTFFGVPVIQDISSNAEIGKFTPIYFLHSCRASIKMLVERYISNLSSILSKGKKPKKSRSRSSAYLFFTHPIQDNDFELLKLIPSKYILCLYETNFFHNAVEERVFTVPRISYRNSPFDTLKREVAIASSIASVLSFLNPSPVICYKKSSIRSTRIVHFLQEALAEAEKPSKDKKQSLVVVLDRIEDLSATLLHSFVYQSALYDLLSVDSLHRVSLDPPNFCDLEKGPPEGVAKKQSKKELLKNLSDKKGKKEEGAQEESSSTITLSIQKDTWLRARHLHIGQASKILYRELDEFAKTDAATRVLLNKNLNSPDSENNFKSFGKSSRKERESTLNSQDFNKSFSELEIAIRTIPKQQERTKEYQAHMSILGALYNEIERRDFTGLLRAELDLATAPESEKAKGVLSSLGAKKSPENVFCVFLEEYVKGLQKKGKKVNEVFSEWGRARIFLLFSVFAGEEEWGKRRKKLADLLELGSWMYEELSGFRRAFFTTLNDKYRSPVELRKLMGPDYKLRHDKSEFDFMSFKPSLTKAMEELVTKGKVTTFCARMGLDIEGDYKKFENELNIHKMNHKRRERDPRKHLDPKIWSEEFGKEDVSIVIFITANVSFEEAKDIYELGYKSSLPILLGSENFMAGDDFVKELLNKDKAIEFIS